MWGGGGLPEQFNNKRDDDTFVCTTHHISRAFRGRLLSGALVERLGLTTSRKNGPKKDLERFEGHEGRQARRLDGLI
jgi:hypothetical protein